MRAEALLAQREYDDSELAGVNPNSLHSLGRKAAAHLEVARREIARSFGARVRPTEIILTNGGTEANQLALIGLAEGARQRDRKRSRVIVSAIEHDSILDNLPLLRAAEVMLNYAEAKAELGTLTQDDLTISVNEIRNRVEMPALNMAEANKNPDWYLSSEEYGYPNVTGANKGVILEIRRERAVELIQEGLRLQDLYRWKAGYCIDQTISGMYFPGPGEYDLSGKGKTDLILYTAGSTKAKDEEGVSVYELGSDIILSEGNKGYVYYHKTVENQRPGFKEERDYLYPIPSGERSLNPNLTQNPGWSDGLDF